MSLAQRAEELGFSAISISDHIVIPKSFVAPYPYSKDHRVAFPAECVEQLTTLSFLAAKTSKVKLLTSIMVVPHRNPILAAKMLASLDLLSGGRLIIGAGVGWLEEEFDALGIPPFRERGQVASEYIRAYRDLWGSEVSSFQGRYVRYSDIVLAPKPMQPHIPIWIGGESKNAMKRAAELGDGWYPTPNNPARPMKTLAQLSAAAGEFHNMD
jgi:probable F420-dependent oxidoreductase